MTAKIIPAGERVSLLTAEQIENDCPVLIQDLGKQIAAHYDKLVKCEDKAEQHRIAIGQLLVQVKKACDAGGFTMFRERFCPNLGKSQAHELLQIASGKKTVEEVKAESRGRKAKQRAKNKAEGKSSVTVTDEVKKLILDGKLSVTSDSVTDEVSAAKYMNGAALANSDSAGTDTPRSETVADAEAEVKALKALKAKLKNGEAEDKIDAQVSAMALAEFKAACGKQLPKMNGNDLQEAIGYFAEVVEVPANELIPDLRDMQIELKIAKKENTALKRKLAGKLPPRESRAQAWPRLAGEAAAVIEELINYQSEFESAKDAQPDSLQDGPFAQKCDQICDIDLGSALSTLQEAEAAEVPLGFGRD